MSESMNFPTVDEPACEFTVTTTAVPSDGGTLTGAGAYSMSEEATVVATPSVPTSVDVGLDLVFLMDESGSGGPYLRALFNNTMPALDAALLAAGIGVGSVANQYALVGFASMVAATHGAVANVAHPHYALGAFAGFLAAIDEIATDPGGGPVEDVYEALSYAVNNVVWRTNTGVTRIIISLCDEDRGQHLYTEGGVSQSAQFQAILAELVAAQIHYIAIGSECGIEDGLGNQIVGFSRSPDKTWRADGAGGYTNGTGGNATLDGNTDATYPTGVRDETLELALHESLTGTFWDFEFFRVGLGNCSTNGTAVTRITGNGFTTSGAANGGAININGVDYVIATVNSDDSITLTATAGVQAAADWLVPRVERDSFLAAITDSMVESAEQLLSWTFDGWYDELGVRVSTDLSYTFRVDGDRALEARFVFG